jgi:uncharacterized protein YdaU (DUF1376 family)
MNYFELYPGDYQRDTAALTLAQHGAFLLLLMTYYSTEKPLPNDNPTLFRIVRAMTSDEQSDVLIVADLFFPVGSDDGLRHNERADADIAKARIRIESARSNGLKGGRPKKPAENPLGSDPVKRNETQDVTETKAPQTPYTIQKQEAKERAGARSTKSRGTRLSSDWAPDSDLTNWARAERPDLQITAEIAKFRDYWAAKAGAGGVKLDWSATFRNWIRNSKSPGATHANSTAGRKLSVVEQVEQAIHDRRARDDGGDAALAALGHG